MEWLAVDQRLLLEHILQQNGRIHYLKPILLLLEQLKKPSVNSINETIGRALLDLVRQYGDTIFLTILANHPADLAAAGQPIRSDMISSLKSRNYCCQYVLLPQIGILVCEKLAGWQYVIG